MYYFLKSLYLYIHVEKSVNVKVYLHSGVKRCFKIKLFITKMLTLNHKSVIQASETQTLLGGEAPSCVNI